MKSCMKGYALRKSRGRSWDILSENTSGTHEQRMGATPEPQGAPGRIADSRVLLGRHSDNRRIVGRHSDIQQSKNVPKSPENEMSVQMSPESEGCVPIVPEHREGVECRPKQSARRKLKRSPSHLFRTSSQV